MSSFADDVCGKIFILLLVNSLKNEQRFLILMIKSFVDSVSVAVSVLLCPVQLVFLL